MEALPRSVLLGADKPLKRIAYIMGVLWLFPLWGAAFVFLTPTGVFVVTLIGFLLLLQSLTALARLEVDGTYERWITLARATTYPAIGTYLLIGLVTATEKVPADSPLPALGFLGIVALIGAGALFLCLGMRHASRRTGLTRLDRKWRIAIWSFPASCAMVVFAGFSELPSDMPKLVQIVLGLSALSLVVAFPVACFFSVRAMSEAVRHVTFRYGRDGLQRGG